MSLHRCDFDPLIMRPCPFCGSTEITYFSGWRKGARKYDDKDFREPTISCQCGGFSVGMFFWGVSDEEAERVTKKAWNRRE
jgi:hypothetical protein